jgi:predicted nucleic acid-binding protein
MIVVSDTSPINYLLLIGQIDLLPRLFEKVIIPDAVLNEMLDPSAPKVLQQWIVNSPSWLTIQAVPVIDETLSPLDLGEQAAITLAQTLPADLLVIDERLGRQIACDRGIPLVGTLGILDAAATQGLIDLAETIAQLQKTNFRASRRIIQALLDKQTN